MLTESQAMEQLGNRFHQDFKTQVTKQQPVNEILIPILTNTLTSRTGQTFGFGLTVSQIPARDPTQTACQHLDALILLTQLSAKELSLRYRTDFMRTDAVISDPVWENIHTLHSFFRDSFQSVPDSISTHPDILAQHNVPDRLSGYAPFFLLYEEWLLQQRTPDFENYYMIRESFDMKLTEDVKENIGRVIRVLQEYRRKEILEFYQRISDLYDQFREGCVHLNANRPQAARDIFEYLESVAHQLIIAHSSVTNRAEVGNEYTQQLARRRNYAVQDMQQLSELTLWWRLPRYYPWNDALPEHLAWWEQAFLAQLEGGLQPFTFAVIPVMCGQAALELGDFPSAIYFLGQPANFIVAMAEPHAKTAYQENPAMHVGYNHYLHSLGTIPYTVCTRAEETRYPFRGFYPQARDEVVPQFHSLEKRFFALQLGEAMLQWADSTNPKTVRALRGRANSTRESTSYMASNRPSTLGGLHFLGLRPSTNTRTLQSCRSFLGQRRA
jgi:hypothetical protein